MLNNSPKKKEPIRPMERCEFLTHIEKIIFFQKYLSGFNSLKHAKECFTELANQKNIEET